jgi:hypothetical protein
MSDFSGTGTLACAPSAWQQALLVAIASRYFVNHAQARVPVLRKV